MNNSSSFLSTKPWLPLNTLLHKLHKHGQTCFVRCSRRGNLDNHYADSPDNDIVVMFWNLGVSGLTLIPAWTSNHVPSKVCLIAKYAWVLNKLSLNCGIGPGSPFGAKPFPKPMMTWHHLCKYATTTTTTTTKSRKANDINIYFYTNIGHLQRPHILNVHL